MNLEIGKTYRLRIQMGSEALTYTAKIISISNEWVSFVDKMNVTLSYNLKYLISYEEVGE